jgi:hypothetical protein
MDFCGMALKPKHGNRMAERIASIARMLTLTRQEQLIVAALLISMVIGALVMHLRQEYGWRHPLPAGEATPRASASPGGG